MPCYTAPPPWEGAARQHGEQAVRILCVICANIDVTALDDVLLRWLLEHRRIDVWMLEQPYMTGPSDPAELAQVRAHQNALIDEWRRRHPKPSVPEHVERFAAYYRENPTWGNLHIVLDDGNLATDHVTFCLNEALEHGDVEGAALAEILLSMSVTQRSKIGRQAVAFVRDNPPPSVVIPA